MKLEAMDVSESERRVLLFDTGDPRSEDGAAQAYIGERGMEPKRRYRETHGATEYQIYYFRLCYHGGHLDHLVGLTPRPGCGLLPPPEC